MNNTSKLVENNMMVALLIHLKKLQIDTGDYFMKKLYHSHKN